jgi:hAT family C-terminal dimerisation region
MFGILQKIFTLFATSVNRWKILTEHLKTYTLKKLSDTRWEARIESVKAVRYQFCEVHDALVSLADKTQQSDAVTSHKATTLGLQLEDFSFIVSLIIWYDVLFQINVVSKASQSPKIDFIQFSEMLEKCCLYLENYRQTGFEQAIVAATEIASELNVQPLFKTQKRLRRVKRRQGEEAVDEPINEPKKKFEVEFFNALLDTVLMSMKERFQQLQDFSIAWSFLFNIKNIQNKEELMKHCSTLQEKLTVHSKSDIDGELLCDEILGLQHYLKDNQATPIEVLNFINKHNLQELFPNTWITLRILLTIPVTVASGERSFSKLKLIKTYLRSTMSQIRLTSLASLSIENEVAENLDFSILIKEFSDKKARKVKFC